MSPMRAAATARARLGLALMVGAVIALLMPWLTATTDAPSLVVLTAVAVAALTGLAGPAAMRAVAAHAPPRTAAEAEGVVLLPGRVTDTLHHPLRPRAPGVV